MGSRTILTVKAFAGFAVGLTVLGYAGLRLICAVGPDFAWGNAVISYAEVYRSQCR